MSFRLTSCALPVGLFALLLAGCDQMQSPGGGKWNEHTQGVSFVVGYERGLEEMRTAGKPAMMFVTTTWCSWCKKLAADNFNDPAVRKLLDNFVCVIVDGDEEDEAKRLLGVEGYPHIILLAPTGRPVGECLGYKPVSEFKPILEKALAKSRG